MKALAGYKIALGSLKEGVHFFQYVLNGAFFEHFEESLIGECEFEVQLSIDRQPDLMILSLVYHGFMVTECDRCAETIELPMEDSRQLLLKFAEADMEDEEEVIYLSFDAEEFDVALLLYDVISLSVPMVKKYDCEADVNAHCNKEVLEYLDRSEDSTSDDSVWDDLKNIKL